MSPKILIFLAAICFFQNGVSAASVTKRTQLDFLADKETDVNPRGIISCIPRLWEAIKVTWNVYRVVGDFNSIRNELRKSIDKCKKLTNADEEKKCRDVAEKAAQEKTQKVYEGLQLLVPRILSLLNKFKTCLFG